MKIILKIKDEDHKNNPVLVIREAARAVLFDEADLVPILFVSQHNYHKLPGGGIEEKERPKTALKREVMEEVGAEIEIGEELGKTVEFRLFWNLKQISYCYLGKVLAKGKPSYTESEKANGFELVWLTLDEAIATLTDDKPDNYEGTFIQKRDLAFLKKAKEVLNSN